MMADFCQKCAKETWGDDIPSDFIGLVEEGQYIQVLCEGCGYILVDHNGKKVERRRNVHE